MKIGLLVALAGLCVSQASAQGVADAYTLVELQRLDPGQKIVPSKINNHGIVVGWSEIGSTQTAVVFAPDGSVVPVAIPGNPVDTYAFGINDEGYVLCSADSDGVTRVIKPTGEALELEAPVSYDSPSGSQLNARGDVAGVVRITYGPDDFELFPAIWTLTPNGYEAEVLAGQSGDGVSAMSDTGLVGYWDFQDVFGSHNGGVYDPRTGTEVVYVTGEFGAEPNDINSGGRVVFAYGEGPDGILTRIANTNGVGTMTDPLLPLGCAGSATPSCAHHGQLNGLAINDSDVVVGYCSPVILDDEGWPKDLGPQTAFIWSAETSTLRLDDLVIDSDLVGWSLKVAVDINEAGWIIGRGTKDGEDAAFLLIPREACAGDVNRDGGVTPADFTAWISAFNSGCD